MHLKSVTKYASLCKCLDMTVKSVVYEDPQM